MHNSTMKCFSTTTKKISQIFLAGLILTFCSQISAQEDILADSDEHKTTTEISIQGPRSARVLRKELDEMTDVVHNLFNELNDEPEFDIVCHVETGIGTKMKAKKCAPNYVNNATSREIQAYLRSMPSAGSSSGAPNGRIPANAVLAVKNIIFKEKMASFAKENKEFRDALNNRLTVEQELQEMTKTFFSKN